MSDLLSGLQHYVLGNGVMVKVGAPNGYVLDRHMRSALRNPPPALMFDLRRVVYDAMADASIPATMDREAFIAHAVLAFLAGGDDE